MDSSMYVRGNDFMICGMLYYTGCAAVFTEGSLFQLLLFLYAVPVDPCLKLKVMFEACSIQLFFCTALIWMYELCMARWWYFYKMMPALRSGSQPQIASVNCCSRIVPLNLHDIDCVAPDVVVNCCHLCSHFMTVFSCLSVNVVFSVTGCHMSVLVNCQLHSVRYSMLNC